MSGEVHLFVTGLCGQGVHETECIPGKVQKPIGLQIIVVGRGPAGCPPVAALIGCDHVETRFREPLQQIAPAPGEFREAVQQQHRWSAG